MLSTLNRSAADGETICTRSSELTSSPSQPATDALAAKIMIVDDEPTNVKLVRRLLQLEGYSRFVTTEDAASALSLVRDESPDLLLLDLMMPNISGLDILAELRDDPRSEERR